MIEIRKFQPEDEQNVKRLISGIMAEEFSAEQNAYPTQDLDDIPGTYGGLGEAFFVAVKGKDIVGTVGIKKEDERVAFMRRLFVSQECRKQQLGLKLIDRALEFCQEVGYQELVFKTTSGMKAANSVCERKGFVQRAKLELGDTDLLKYVHPLQNASA